MNFTAEKTKSDIVPIKTFNLVKLGFWPQKEKFWTKLLILTYLVILYPLKY